MVRLRRVVCIASVFLSNVTVNRVDIRSTYIGTGRHCVLVEADMSSHIRLLQWQSKYTTQVGACFFLKLVDIASIYTFVLFSGQRLWPTSSMSQFFSSSQ